jgi:parvulin-like peptidyl-prolyl isomerase
MTGTEPLLPVRHAPKWKRRFLLLGGSVAVVALCLVIRSIWGPEGANAQAQRGKAEPAVDDRSAADAPAAQPKLDVAAVVNHEKITRDELARDCIMHYGKDVLESLVNKHLIAEQCRQRSIVVTRKEVDGEIDRMAERFGLPTEQWLKLLKEERGIGPEQYARDIIWPTIALRKLAATRVEPTKQEVLEAYETQFGPAVQVRLIAITNLEKAREVRAKAVKKPDEFGILAKQESEDPNSASAKGIIQPIRKHLGDAKIEQVAFAMQPGEISDLIAVQGQYVILKCEAHLPARPVPMNTVEKTLSEAVRDKKLRLVAEQVFKELQKASVVENIFNDPQKRQAYPGVAAKINGATITMRELAEECIERHGGDVLSGAINHRLLEQECKRRGVVIGKQDTDAEVARAAVAMGKTTKGGTPDVDAWLKQVTVDQGMSLEMYLHDVVWPSVALKKLVGDKVEVSEDDLRKGYEANYGPRVRCRAIVLNQQRRAQEVWELARKKPTIENFGQLAAEYSVEAGSRSLEGEVPPIQKHGGQPMLEQEAFALRPGELSSIVQVGDKFVILFCEGRTEPIEADFNEVRKDLYEDIHEKKLRIAMAAEFKRIQEGAQIDNYLAGTSQSSKLDKQLLRQKRSPDDIDLEPATTSAARPAARSAVRPASANLPRQAPLR